MEASNTTYEFPQLVGFCLNEEVDRIAEQCRYWSDDCEGIKTASEVKKELIERMIANYNINGESQLKLVELRPNEIAWASNPKDSSKWDWGQWETKLKNLACNRYENGQNKFQEVLREIEQIICLEIKWEEQSSVLKELQHEDGISRHKTCEQKIFIHMMRSYSQTLKPCTKLVKGMISRGFLTKETIDKVYSCVINKK
jgi:hypothetical protein